MRYWLELKRFFLNYSFNLNITPCILTKKKARRKFCWKKLRISASFRFSDSSFSTFEFIQFIYLWIHSPLSLNIMYHHSTSSAWRALPDWGQVGSIKMSTSQSSQASKSKYRNPLLEARVNWLLEASMYALHRKHSKKKQNWQYNWLLLKTTLWMIWYVRLDLHSKCLRKQRKRFVHKVNFQSFWSTLWS